MRKKICRRQGRSRGAVPGAGCQVLGADRYLSAVSETNLLPDPHLQGTRGHPVYIFRRGYLARVVWVAVVKRMVSGETAPPVSSILMACSMVRSVSVTRFMGRT